MEFKKVNKELLEKFISNFPKKEKISETSIEERVKRSNRINVVIGLVTFSQLQYTFDFANKNDLKFNIIPISNYRVVIDMYEPFNLDLI